MVKTVVDHKYRVGRLNFTFYNDDSKIEYLKAKKIIKQVMKKIYAEYERLEQDIRGSPDK